jgi:hypothetical protein
MAARVPISHSAVRMLYIALGPAPRPGGGARETSTCIRIRTYSLVPRPHPQGGWGLGTRLTYVVRARNQRIVTLACACAFNIVFSLSVALLRVEFSPAQPVPLGGLGLLLRLWLPV